MADPASWDIFDEDWEDITDWADDDSGNGVSEESPSGQLHLYVSPAAEGSQARRQKDVGSYPDTYTVEFKVYHDTLGTQPNNDYFNLSFLSDDWRLIIPFASDGVYVYDGDSYNKVGSITVEQDTWITWRLLITKTADPANATVDIYKNGILQASNVDCSATGEFTDGTTIIGQLGYTVATESHMEYFKAASGLYAPEVEIDNSLFFGANF